MKHVEVRTVPASKREIVVAVTCCWCKQFFDEATDNSYSDSINWGDRAYERNVTGMFSFNETNYPEDGRVRKGVEYHLCPECFERVEEWLRTQGAEPSEVND